MPVSPPHRSTREARLNGLPASAHPNAKERRPAGEPVEGEFARFFGYSHDILAIMDRGARVLLVSPSVERVLGHSIETLMGESLLEWVHPEDQPAVRSKGRALLGGGAVTELDTRMLRSDGSWASLRWSLSLGPYRRIYAVGQDRGDAARHREALLREQLAELRLRTAMELHDGILQTLTAAGLQIAVARRLLGQDPEGADRVLEALADGVAAEQRELRLYVDEVKGRPPAWTDGSLPLGARIEAMLDSVGLIWGIGTDAEVDLTRDPPPEVGRQLLRIVQEATVNAARHGGASAVAVDVRREGTEAVIRIDDDGHGFSFLGEYDTEALKLKRLGPLSLKHRVAEAGGRIFIRSTTEGATVVVRLPMAPAEAD